MSGPEDDVRLRLLANTARAIADASLDVDATLVALAQTVVPGLADDCIVFVIEDDGSIRRVAEAAVDPRHEALLRALRENPPVLQGSNITINTVLAGKTMFVPRVDDRMIENLAGSTAHGASLREIAPKTYVTVPLMARGHTVGAFTFGMSTSDRTYALEDIALAEELGRRAGMAVDNARLFRDAVRARARAEHAEQRMMRLQETTESLSRVMDPLAAGAAILAQLQSVFTASGGAIYRRRDDQLDLLASTRAEDPPAMPLGAEHAIAIAARTGQHLFDARATMVLALTIKGQVIGAVALDFANPRGFSSDERRFADAIAWQCALALDRALLVQRERDTSERTSFLGAASDLLAVSREPESVFADLVRLVVPRFADWCTLDLLDGERIRQVAIGHREPVKLQWVEALRRKYGEHCSIHTVIRTAKAERFEQFTPELLDTLAIDAEHRDILTKLSIRSAILVPMIASGKPLGSMTLAWSQRSGRNYERDDLELFEELAHRAALAIDNVRLYRDLKQAVQVRDDFLAAAGHELKTPLAALLMHVESLERLAKRNTSPANLATRLAKAGRTGTRLERLIDELLDVSRITAGRLRLEPEPVQLDELVHDVVDRFTDQAVSAECAIAVVAQPVAGLWDRLRIDQVVSNLITNALKYGRGKPIEIAVACAGEHALLRVTDHGIGIATTEQTKIFERFERAVESREFGGFGLGLWIARQIVEASAGTIEVVSVPGQGATFSVRLPLVVHA